MNEQTIEKMKTMKLYGMVRSFRTSLENPEKSDFSPDEFISMLVDAEWDERHNRKLDRSLKNARFRYKAAVEQINFKTERQLDRNYLLRLADCGYIDKKENVIITGSTGIGKSYIASALGHQACSMGYKVFYEHSTKLFARLKMCKADGSYLKEITRMEKQDLLIIDDFGIQPLDAQSRTMLMEIIEDRHSKRSTIFTSQVPVNKWYEVIGEITIADAILDRIVHDAHRMELKGESLRKKKAEEQTKTDKNETEK
jgi:DNA replication protein DnaC